MHIGIEQADPKAGRREGDREIARDGGFSDTTLGARNRDDAARRGKPTLGGGSRRSIDHELNLRWNDLDLNLFPIERAKNLPSQRLGAFRSFAGKPQSDLDFQ